MNSVDMNKIIKSLCSDDVAILKQIDHSRLEISGHTVNGRAVDSNGWIYLEYGENVLSSTFIIDFEDWPTEILKGKEGQNFEANHLFKNVKIDYTSNGSNKGSWSVQGLEVCQDAFFYLASVSSILDTIGKNDLKPLLSFFVRQCETCDQLAIIATNMVQAMHGIMPAKDFLTKQMFRLKELDIKPYFKLLETFLYLCPF